MTASGRRSVSDPDLPDPLDGPVRATEFVGSAVTSQGIVDRAAGSEEQRVAAAAPADAGVLANNPQIVFSNQAYKGYALVEAGDRMDVRYRAVHEARDAGSGVFTLHSFRVEPARAGVIDAGA